jgi:DNA-binding LytR/AlgR family response regulator
MNTLKVLIVDDEFLALDLLENFIEKIPNYELVARTKNPIEALQILNSTVVDVLYLDIQMPALSGINLLKSLKNKPLVVFTTAYQEHALDAFDLNAIDYLLKPFSFERFLQSVSKVTELKTNTIPISNPKAEFISIKSDGKTIKLYFKDLLFIEGMREYVKFQCRDKSYLVLDRMKHIEVKLPSNFIRTHKSFIIAKDKVTSLNGNLLEIEDYRIPISRDRKKIVINHIFN